MSEFKRVTRADKHTKRRNNNRKILFFVGLAVIFIIILIILNTFGSKSDETEQIEEIPENVTITDEEESTDEETTTHPNDEVQSSDEELVEEVDEVDDVVIQQVESADENVIEAYTGNWPPIETSQKEPHTTNYDDGSDDRAEIKQAVSIVTGIDEKNIVEHWVGNGGEQKVITTVSKKDSDDYYHVYLTWIEQEGWQVTKVERIKEFEKKSIN